VYNITGQKANPNIPIPLPDMRDQPPGSQVPPASPLTTHNKPIEITPVSEAAESKDKEGGGGGGGEKGGEAVTSQPAEKSEDKDWKELNKHSIGHILDSGDSTEATDDEQAAAAKKNKEGVSQPAGAAPVTQSAAVAPPTMQARSNGVPFQPLGAGFHPSQSYPSQGSAAPPPPTTSYSNFAPSNGTSHHGPQQQQQANLYYPPPQPYHPPYTAGYDINGPANYSTFQAGPNPSAAHPYPPYPAAPLGVPKTNWAALSCPYSIAQCPLYCCHVRAMQELEEGATDWARPYGPPASGFGDPCHCCINT
jgi:hypothetical protein